MQGQAHKISESKDGPYQRHSSLATCLVALISLWKLPSLTPPDSEASVWSPNGSASRSSVLAREPRREAACNTEYQKCHQILQK
jgi:hypothetical protein